MSILWDNDITGGTRPYVMELQNYLRYIQRARYGTTTVPMDGFYDINTVRGVEQFQTDEGMPATGTVDMATWEAIFLAYQTLAQEQNPPIPIRGMRTNTLQPGDQGDAVQFLNIMLGIISADYSNATTEAVRNIQRASLLPITGITDKATWDAITSLYNQGGIL